MLERRLYYHLKPILPWRLRIALRRVRARRIWRNCKDRWPILESAARRPAGWPGWPNGKHFAVVLTHDVERSRGLEHCQSIMDVEQRLGFRSSFNLVPEGYTVPREFRQFISKNGFEVGVHDLRHEGHLFARREEFREAAMRINHYLADWEAVGFRAAFMLHELSWLHDLNIAYDASTFDTDPFEPQPDGVDTIFPFWVPADAAGPVAPGVLNRGPEPPVSAPDSPRATDAPVCRGGYVELPYTLPQDSTLFLILKEPDAGIWKRKVDWIAERGGMVLINVHPDYLHHAGTGAPNAPTVLECYADLLSHLTRKYNGAFWHVLPRKMAAFVRQWKGVA